MNEPAEDQWMPDEPPTYSLDPATAAAARRVERGGHCACLVPRTKKGAPLVPNLHTESQDVAAPGWARLNQLIDQSNARLTTTFEPSAQMDARDFAEVITLPAGLRNLAKVREIRLYGSHLRRLPPEIGNLAALQRLDVYTSYSLHWLPYEITRCKALHLTRMSTRALYGNGKTRLPFPRLSGPVDCLTPSTCSICDQPFDRTPKVFWTTLRVGTDDAPLLIHSCSRECMSRVPDAPAGYLQRPHRGGGGVPFRRTDS